MLMVTGELEEAKQQFLAALDKDSLNVGIYLQLSLLERATGNMESAIELRQEVPGGETRRIRSPTGAG